MKLKLISRRLFLFASMIGMMLVLSAFTLETKSQVTFDGNFAGSRVFTISIDKKSYFYDVSENIASIDASIRKNTPKTLQYSGFVDRGEFYEATLTMPFSGREDYISKIEDLVKSGGTDLDDRKIVLNNYDNPFIQGFVLSEPFRQSEILLWVKNALIQDQISDIDRQYGSALDYESDKPIVVFNGVQWASTSEENIEVQNVKDNAFSRVRIFTSLGASNYLDTVVSFHTLRPMVVSQDELFQSYVKEHMPEGGQVIETNEPTARAVKFSSKTIEELVANLKKLLADDTITLEVISQQDPTDKQMLSTRVKGFVGCAGVCSPLQKESEPNTWHFISDPSVNEISRDVFPTEVPTYVSSLGLLAYPSDKSAFEFSIQRPIRMRGIKIATVRDLSGAYTQTFQYEMHHKDLGVKKGEFDYKAAFDPKDAGTINVTEDDEKATVDLEFKAPGAIDMQLKLDDYMPGVRIDESGSESTDFSPTYGVNTSFPIVASVEAVAALDTFEQSFTLPTFHSFVADTPTGEVSGNTVKLTKENFTEKGISFAASGPTSESLSRLGLGAVIVALLGAGGWMYRRQLKKAAKLAQENAAKMQQDFNARMQAHDQSVRQGGPDGQPMQYRPEPRQPAYAPTDPAPEPFSRVQPEPQAPHASHPDHQRAPVQDQSRQQPPPQQARGGYDSSSEVG